MAAMGPVMNVTEFCLEIQNMVLAVFCFFPNFHYVEVTSVSDKKKEWSTVKKCIFGQIYVLGVKAAVAGDLN